MAPFHKVTKRSENDRNKNLKKGMQTKTKMKTTTRQSLRHLAKKVPRKNGLSLTRTTGPAWWNLLIEKEYEGKLFPDILCQFSLCDVHILIQRQIQTLWCRNRAIEMSHKSRKEVSYKMMCFKTRITISSGNVGRKLIIIVFLFYFC